MENRMVGPSYLTRLGTGTWAKEQQVASKGQHKKKRKHYAGSRSTCQLKTSVKEQISKGRLVQNVE